MTINKQNGLFLSTIMKEWPHPSLKVSNQYASFNPKPFQISNVSLPTLPGSIFNFSHLQMPPFTILLVLSTILPVISALRGVHPSNESLYRSHSCVLRDAPSSPPIALPLERINDDYCDCLDSSDEPGTAACPGAIFWCRNRAFRPVTIPSSWVDDGSCDCCDGSDEPSNTCLDTCAEMRQQGFASAKKRAEEIRAGVATREAYAKEAGRLKEKDRRELATLEREIKAVGRRLKESTNRAELLRKRKDYEDRISEAERQSNPSKERKEGGEADTSGDNARADDHYANDHSDQKEGGDHDELKVDHDELGSDGELENIHDRDEYSQDFDDDEDDDFDEIVDDDDSVHTDRLQDDALKDDYDADGTAKTQRDVTEIKENEEDEADSQDGEDAQNHLHDDYDDDDFVDDEDEDYDEDDEYDGDEDEISEEEQGTFKQADSVTAESEEQTNDDTSKDDAVITDSKDDAESDKPVLETSVDVDSVCARLESNSPNVIMRNVAYLKVITLAKLRRLLPGIISASVIGESSDLADCVRKADSATWDLETKKRDIEGKISVLKERMNTDYGPDGALRKLYGSCIKKTITQYEFELCPFDLVRQYEHGSAIAVLGKFRGWEDEDAKRYMSYKNGDTCWNGPQRTIRVELICGRTENIASVEEPNRCAYSMKFETPAVCESLAADAILADFADLEGEPKQEL